MTRAELMQTTLLALTKQNVTKGSGGSVRKTLLRDSEQKNIVVEAFHEDYAGEDMWGGLSVYNPLLVEIEADSIYFGPQSWAEYSGLPRANTSATCYILAKQSLITGTADEFAAFSYSESTGNAPGVWAYNGQSNYSTFYRDDTFNVSSVDWHLYAMAVDVSTRNAYFYCDGRFYGSLAFNNSGRNLTITCRANQIGKMQAYIKYVGVVYGAENASVVLPNMRRIMSAYGVRGT